jgi:hypothetical protein
LRYGAARGRRVGERSQHDEIMDRVVAPGYLSSLIGNSRMSGYLERHRPEILTGSEPL